MNIRGVEGSSLIRLAGPDHAPATPTYHATHPGPGGMATEKLEMREMRGAIRT